jgi:hypothetical protein
MPIHGNGEMVINRRIISQTLIFINYSSVCFCLINSKKAANEGGDWQAMEEA